MYIFKHDRRFTIELLESGWWEVRRDGDFLYSVVFKSDAFHVIYNYVKFHRYITDDDFDKV